MTNTDERASLQTMTTTARTPSKVADARITDLRPHPGNPRKISQAKLEQLQRTLEAERDMLQARPLIALPDGTVIAGNQRLAAARALGWESIPVVFADLDEATARRWMLLDNRPAGEDDVEALAQMLRELDEVGRDLAGYAAEDVDAILRAALPVSPRDPDDAPPVPAVPKSRLGEVYELGPHRLMCGDACSSDDVAMLLAGATPVVMVTDPPYGVELDAEWRDRAGVNGAPAQASYMRDESGSRDVKADWSDAFELVPSLMVAYVWHASRYTVEVLAGLERIGFEHFQQIIWDKGLAMRTRTHYWFAHEPAWYARKPRAPWYGKGGTANATIWRAHPPKFIMGGDREERFAHPTQKPAALMVTPIENHLHRDEIVYEPFCGSGTTLIAAEQTGRRCLAMEIDPGYCDVIRQRYADYTGQPQYAP